MFLYCFDYELRNKLLADGQTLLHESTNEKGVYWVFELSDNLDFSLEDYEVTSYMITKKMMF